MRSKKNEKNNKSRTTATDDRFVLEYGQEAHPNFCCQQQSSVNINLYITIICVYHKMGLRVNGGRVEWPSCIRTGKLCYNRKLITI